MLIAIFFFGYPLTEAGQNQSRKALNKVFPDNPTSPIANKNPEEKLLEDASRENQARYECKDEKQVNEVDLRGSSLRGSSQQEMVEDANVGKAARRCPSQCGTTEQFEYLLNDCSERK